VENIVVVTFDEPSGAHQGLTELRRLDDSGAVKVRAVTVVERRPDGVWRIADEVEHPRFVGTVTGGIIGTLLGALTGPLGFLLGATAGVLAGEVIDVTEDEASELILEAMIARIPPGTTALLADVDEPTTDALDAAMEKFGARITRWDRGEVEAELEGAGEATEAGRRETRRIFHRLKEKAGTV
jgi:uncharacterized membrane protein